MRKPQSTIPGLSVVVLAISSFNVTTKIMRMTFDDAKQKVAAVAQKSRKFKIGVTSLPKWWERLNQSDYSGSYGNIEGIVECSQEQIARDWEKALINEFHKALGNQNDPNAGGTGSLDSSGPYVIYVVYS